MRFHKSCLLFSAAVAIFCAAAQQTSNLLRAQEPALVGTPAAAHVGPPQLYPNPAITPGLAETVSADDLKERYQCPHSIHKLDCTYSQSHRNVSAKKHTQAYDNYNVPANKRNAKSGEIDHFDPLCNGGSNDLKNLWFQPAKNPWNKKNFGYHEKDDLETWVCEQVKNGNLDPKVAFERITSDWVAYYMEVKPKRAKPSN